MTLPSEMNPTHGTILVVDDEPDILIALEDLFEDDYRVLTASSPIKALDIIRKEPDIAIIISDQRMPEMQGDEFLAKARNVTDAEAILLTGYADLKAVIGAVNRGRIMAYAPKPWDPAALTNMVAAAYQRRMLARELDTERSLLHGLMDSVVLAVGESERTEVHLLVVLIDQRRDADDLLAVDELLQRRIDDGRVDDTHGLGRGARDRRLRGRWGCRLGGNCGKSRQIREGNHCCHGQ